MGDNIIKPKISVIMGAYNAENRIRKSVESIIKQDFQDWELIICDDGSKDNTLRVLKKIEKLDDRIIVIKNKKNMGLAYSLNHCISIARGEYIARMDDDDFSHSNRLSVQYEYMQRHSEIAVLGTAANLVDSTHIWGEMKRLDYPDAYDIWAGRSFIHPTVMIRKDALINSGLYTVAKYVGRTEDYDMWCKIYAAGYKGHNLQEKLIDYYEDRTSFSKRKYIYRGYSTRLRLLWRKSLNIPLKKLYVAFIPMLHGLIPIRLMRNIRTKRFGQ